MKLFLLSNPVFMNDFQEINSGIELGAKVLNQSEAVLAACGSNERAKLLKEKFFQCMTKFHEEHLIDTYVFCLSEHDENDADGRLSMWRGYGRNGDGAAIVFRTDPIGNMPQSPLRFMKVKYMSNLERERFIVFLLKIICDFLEMKDIFVPDDLMHMFGFLFFVMCKEAALLIKHDGFSEEREWRVVYEVSRDSEGVLIDGLTYMNTGNGIEPKCSLKLDPSAINPAATWRFMDIVDRLIFGPCINRPLGMQSVRRMLTTIGKAELCGRAHFSSIPLRPSMFR